MRKILSTALAFIFVFGLVTISTNAGAAFSDNKIKVVLNGKTIAFNEPVLVESGRVLVDAEPLLKEMDVGFYINEYMQEFTAVRESVDIVMPFDEKIAYINYQGKNIDVTVKVIDGKAFLPVRFISEAFGAEVTWDQTAKTVNIVYDKSKTAYEYAEVDPSLDKLLKNVSFSKVMSIDESTPAYEYNSWGGNMGRGVRLSNGKLYTCQQFLAENAKDPETDRVTYLYEFDGKSWKKVAGPFFTGRNPVSFFKDPQEDKLYMVGWPDVHPTVFVFDPDNLNSPKTFDMFYTMDGKEQNWGADPSNYFCASISPDGIIYLVCMNKNEETKIRHVHVNTFNTNDNTRTNRVEHPLETRCAYFIINAEKNGVMSMALNEDIKWGERGWKRPDGTIEWAFPAVWLWTTDDYGKTFKRTVVHQEDPTQEFLYVNTNNNYSGDYVLGPDGRRNVLMQAQGPSFDGGYSLLHAVYDGDTCVEVKRLKFGDKQENQPPAYARLMFDARGNGYYICFFNNSSKIRVYAVDTTNGIRYSEKYVEYDLGCNVVYSGLWPFYMRNGNAAENYFGFTFPTGENGTITKYFRINLE